MWYRVSSTGITPLRGNSQIRRANVSMPKNYVTQTKLCALFLKVNFLRYVCWIIYFRICTWHIVSEPPVTKFGLNFLQVSSRFDWGPCLVSIELRVFSSKNTVQIQFADQDFVLELGVSRSSVFIFECIVFDTTQGLNRCDLHFKV